MNKVKTKKLFAVIGVLLVMFPLVLTTGGAAQATPPFLKQGTNEYTSVLQDLSKDETFFAKDYPANASDNSLNVIQIAEGVKGELFIYVYQPSGVVRELTATEINMSLSESANGTKLYPLECVNVSGVFSKYLVKDVTVSSEPVRYYNITSIYRDCIDGEEATGTDNVKNAVAFEVGKCYKVTTKNGAVQYECKKTETVDILDKYVDFLRYFNGFQFLGYGSCDGHYVAFSMDRPIENLVEATVYYLSNSLTIDKTMGITSGTKRGEKTSHMLKLSEIDTAVVTGGLFAKDYKWKRIQSVSEFMETEDLKKGTNKQLENKQWVLRFCETEFEVTGDYKLKRETSTEISEVTILRLKFETEGKTYNLGVVDNKQTGDDEPGNNNQFELDPSNNPGPNISELFREFIEAMKKFFTGKSDWWLYLVVSIVIIVIGLPILCMLFPAVAKVVVIILKGICKGILYLFKGLWWLICLPFKAIQSVIKKNRENGSAKAKSNNPKREKKSKVKERPHTKQHKEPKSK